MSTGWLVPGSLGTASWAGLEDTASATRRWRRASWRQPAASTGFAGTRARAVRHPPGRSRGSTRPAWGPSPCLPRRCQSPPPFGLRPTAALG